ncbi:class I SAM-dependent methyltransferase [Tichowtungia aerotolerans]|uniref:Methyltransferase domain-containing protein n=1 Tax=Tichowtungia aerotolerans TaxID=2697043 RepID=A0A6P1M627_9BACT|nr:class I SAM-dependent methyltransferase [Tichowtungia aerotolerans]QHI68064.1 methyltransferase domain-containing protein [Tichowtungia aerotolerans]
MLENIAYFILGRHPNNTCFSYNWHAIRHVRRFLKERVPNSPEKLNIADIGGGAAPYYELFRSVAGQYTVVDLELSDLPPSRKSAITQLIGSAEDIPIESNSVELVICNQVLEHVNVPAKVLSEIFRILRPGGLFLGSVPHVSPIHLEPFDFWRFTELGVDKVLKESGFSNVYVEGSGGVFSTAAFIMAMDLFLSKRIEGLPQRFHHVMSVLLSPFVGIVNLTALLADKLVGNRLRTPANLCWSAQKPDVGNK